MTVPTRTANEDKATEWKEFQGFRRLAEEAMSRYRLHTADARMQITELFHTGIQDAFFNELNFPSKSEDQSQTQLAEKFGVNKTTFGRWLVNGKVPPKTETFVLIAAAVNAEFPRGCRATLQGYCKVYSGIQTRMGKPIARLSESDALCLWAVFRTREWWTAAENGENKCFENAGQKVNEWMQEFRLEEEDDVPATEIQLTLAGHCLAWTILELILNHDWL